MTAKDTESADRAEVRLTHETIVYLEERISHAVRAGISSAMTEENASRFWQAGFKVLQENAAQQAGRFVIGGAWGLIRKASVFLVLGAIIYTAGGWQALVGFFKLVFSGNHGV